jgi:hypothetical protein
MVVIIVRTNTFKPTNRYSVIFYSTNEAYRNEPTAAFHEAFVPTGRAAERELATRSDRCVDSDGGGVAGLLVKQGGAEGAEQDAADLAAAAVNAETQQP